MPKRFNSLSILNCHKTETDNLYVLAVANEFVLKFDDCKKCLVHLLRRILMLNTAIIVYLILCSIDSPFYSVCQFSFLMCLKMNAVLEGLEPKKFLCRRTMVGDIFFQLTNFS